ncbi:hypothetical protein C7S18_20675 [Ahniella affigens]|uniref:Glutaconyl-CoA decarboxylase subunit gamma n=1 Tax=Ahniella affigens TaxID=2021234 RepID=A0A2P1PX69_9GAMM|nr:hypothetical protein [Ahniella affigens]AVP99435.1 hypothetical protein C7S18_20675 [Ahniella affigens]
MMKRLLLTSLICLSVMACSKSEEASPDTNAPAASTAEAAPVAPVADAAPAPAADAEVVTGIPECDEFLHQYQTCLADKVPEQTREVMLQGMAQWKQSWKDMVQDEATKAQLPEVCTRAKESTKSVMDMYGCAM